MTTVSSAIPTHGNYHNYHGYRYHHPGGHDSRLALLPPALLANARVLDVGCNEGWVSCEIAQLWGARRVVGVDIDDALIRMAWRRRRTLWSHQATPLSPSPSASSAWPPTGTDSTSSRPERKRAPHHSPPAPAPAPTQPVADYFPASCQHMFGPLPIPPSSSSDTASASGTTLGFGLDVSESAFPHNVSFRRADWVNERIPEDDAGYDVITAFSVSKWIHLNGGDAGLKRFFDRVYAALVPGGAFILEAQPRESYVKARKLHPTLQENAQNLQIQPDGFEAVLCSIGFEPAQRLGEPGEGRFRRPIDLYVKRG